jgi:hypothetical protein
MKVVNLKEERKEVIDCSRYGDEGLGNPFRMGVDGNRDEVISKWRSWIWAWEKYKREIEYVVQGKTYSNKKVCERIRKFKGDEKLGCYCKPQRCHCDHIVLFFEWVNK